MHTCDTRAGSRLLAILWVCAAVLPHCMAVRAREEPGPDVRALAGKTYVPGETLDIHKGLRRDAWLQLGNTPQRTNYSPAQVRPPFKLRWEAQLTETDPDNRIQPSVQAILAGGLVYVGCKSGVMFALDGETGEVTWQFKAGGPILHTAGYADGTIFFGAMDGRIYAVNAASGKQVWTFDNGRRYGFSTAVLLAEKRIFIADRGGRLFAIGQDDGAEAWHYDAGAPVLQSAAWNAGRVYVASEDMRVHAVAAGDGAPVWKSEELSGVTFRYFWPVVVHGKVVVRSMNMYPNYGQADRAFRDAWKRPEGQSMFILDEKTGREDPVAEHYAYGHSGGTPVPAVTRDGLLVVHWAQAYFDPWRKAKQDSVRKWCGQGFALQDVRTRAPVCLLEHAGETPPLKMHGRPVEFDPDAGPRPGVGAPDETHIPSVIGDVVMVMHHDGWWGCPGHHTSGGYDLTARKWHWEGLREHRDHSNQTGGCSAVSAANGRIYNISFNYVQCHEPAGTE